MAATGHLEMLLAVVRDADRNRSTLGSYWENSLSLSGPLLLLLTLTLTSPAMSAAELAHRLVWSVWPLWMAMSMGLLDMYILVLYQPLVPCTL